MKLNARTEYALLAMAQLAQAHADGAPATMRALADGQRIPEGFLVQILQDLRRAGLVTSTRGACGGYRLSRPPEDVSLADVISAVEGGDCLQSNLAEPTPLAEALVEELEDARCTWQDRLASVSLAKLAQRTPALQSPMWYI